MSEVSYDEKISRLEAALELCKSQRDSWKCALSLYVVPTIKDANEVIIERENEHIDKILRGEK
jgi:hypothetical protein